MKRLKSGAKRKLLKLSLSLVFGGFLAVAGVTGAKAQIINPFGVNNGNTLSKEDFAAGRAAATKLLNETSTVGRYETWDNPASGNHGKLTIEGVFTAKSMPCRKIKSDLIYARKRAAPSSFILNVCKIQSGEWKVLS